VVDGLGMLLHQARPGFEAWFGVAPQVDAELRNFMLADLAADRGAPQAASPRSGA
jgi:shikimate 5-dehydrogenase